MAESIRLREAIPADARILAELLNLAGEGLPAYLWGQLAKPGEEAFDVGMQRVARRQGSFSRGTALVAEVAGEVAGMLLGYRLPDPYPLEELQDCPEVLRPLIELESMAPGSWYVNAVATCEHWRGTGVGSKLMEAAERAARTSRARQISLIVANENSGARNLYTKRGYRPVATRAVVPFPGIVHGGDWVLMIKELS